MIGQSLSHYRITAALGAGGMGEVYRATDANLHRDVAIKVLPPEVAQDPERLGRFKREAHLLAALNHPNIAAIYGLEEADGKPFLALELVEGEDLKERLARGAIPVDEALEIAKQVAEALEEAHGKGIVHRDLKPANVKLTPDGKVKVLDFGLAKAWAGDASGVNSGSSALSQSPTLAHTGTIAGVILGTAAYMSPEQARGKPVDKRSDVWSFGVLLWEMLTGRSLFAGDTVTDVIAAVVTREPDLDALPRATPGPVRQLLSRCLRKDPRTRLPDIGSARLELQEAIAGTASGAAGDGGAEETASAQRRSRLRERLAWASLALVAVALAGYLAVDRLGTKPQKRPIAHFLLEMPDGRKLVRFGGPAVAPDGSRIAFVAMPTDTERTSIWVRSLDSVVSRELSGTEEGFLPFWSPDGDSLAFFAGEELRRISLAGGTPQRICTVPKGAFLAGGDWNADGTLLFSAGGWDARLYSVPAGGGEATPVTDLDTSKGEAAHYWPRFLPDGRHFLFQVLSLKQAERNGVYMASLDAPHERRRIVPGLLRAECRAGHLLFSRGGTLFAQPFDVGRAQLTGQPLALASSVASLRESGADWGWFSAASDESLAYTSQEESRGTELAWFDRKGARLGVVHKGGTHRHIALSPDEKQVAVEFLAPGESTADVWTIDVARGIGTRQTTDKGWEYDPVWSPDGRELVFTSNRDGVNRLYRKSLQGDEPERPFAKALDGVWPEGWTPDGRALIVHHDQKAILALPWSGDGPPEAIIQRSYPMDEPQVSPDGRWLAYIAQEADRWEVYVEPFRRPGARVRVSPDGGGQPKWRADGRELFYVSPDGRLMAVQVKATVDQLDVTLPVALFPGVMGAPTWDRYAVTRDGQRFLVVVPLAGGVERLHVVTNWTSLLPTRPR
jgi:eukaryotic-like serine/threonine-protein kinase